MKENHEHLSSREIEEELDRTRERIDERARELQARLSPGQVFERVYERVRESGGREFLGNLGHRVSENPLPVTLTGIGLAWLMMSTREDSGYAHGGNGHGRARAAEALRSAGEKARSAGEKARTAGEKARERARSAGRFVADRGRELGYQMRTGTHRVQDGWQRMLDEQPLVLGLLGIAAGAALGVLLPRSELEDDWMGDASDEMKRKAVEKGRERFEGAVEGVRGESTGRDR